jgi:hypothetical protein
MECRRRRRGGRRKKQREGRGPSGGVDVHLETAIDSLRSSSSRRSGRRLCPFSLFLFPLPRLPLLIVVVLTAIRVSVTLFPHGFTRQAVVVWAVLVATRIRPHQLLRQGQCRIRVFISFEFLLELHVLFSTLQHLTIMPLHCIRHSRLEFCLYLRDFSFLRIYIGRVV